MNKNINITIKNRQSQLMAKVKSSIFNRKASIISKSRQKGGSNQACHKYSIMIMNSYLHLKEALLHHLIVRKGTTSLRHLKIKNREKAISTLQQK